MFLTLINGLTINTKFSLLSVHYSRRGFLCRKDVFMQFQNIFKGFENKKMSMKQFDGSLDMMRSICAPKFKVSTELLDDLRMGKFTENKELKCYTKCIAQMTGTLTKKGELSYQKMLQQIGTLLPEELQQPARDALEACKDTQKNYSDPCEKAFYTAKCVHEFSPQHFKFP